MISILFLILIFIISLYFTFSRNYALLAHLILFQEIHLIPFNNLGLANAGFIYYTVIALIFFASVTKFSISIHTLKQFARSKIIWSLILLTFIIFFHAYFIGLKSISAKTLVFRFSVQVFPAMLYLIFILKGANLYKFIYQLGYGILFYGFLLFFILVTTTDLLTVAYQDRSDIRGIVGMSPIAITRIGCTMFLTAFVFLANQKNALILKYAAIFISLVLIVLGTSRGPAISMIISLMMYMAIRKKIFKPNFKSLKTLAPIILITILIYTMYSFSNIKVLNLYNERIAGLGAFQELGRIHRYMLALNYFTKELNILSMEFLIGNGPAGFDVVYGLSYVHNFIFELIFEYGFCGMIITYLFLWNSFLLVVKILKSDANQIFLFVPLVLLSLISYSMFSGDLIAWRNLFFMSIILSYVYSNLNKYELKKSHYISRGHVSVF